ncbi:maleylpyruvate isomerase N-terminal domain-containing protein [Dactylosporangium sp. CA-092794]|uniref:maleylpyruvate isomerase N-terminal domain-containing protein n=1 Tax=Dactylosporangium sp. CA-092794 TaxID=3239929 RepID=UPI003D8B038C
MDSIHVGRALDESLSLLAAPAGAAWDAATGTITRARPADGADRDAVFDEDQRTDAAWTVPAGVLEWTCLRTAEHIAHDLTAYATQLAGADPAGYLPLDLLVRPGTHPRDVLRIVAACARLLRLELDAAGPDARAWHWGPADRTGFAAMAVDEILVHTWDIAQGLGLAWTPPAELSAAVLARLFAHDVPPGADPEPGRTLLWATGRIALPGHARRAGWTVRAAV